MTSTESLIGFAWACRHFGWEPEAVDETTRDALTSFSEPSARGSVALAVSIPTDREGVRALRRSLPPRWRSILDRSHGPNQPPNFVLEILQRAVAAHRPRPARLELLGRSVGDTDDLRALATQVGIAGAAVATADIGGRRRARMLRMLPEETAARLRAVDVGPADPLVRAVCADAFVKLAETETDLIERIDQLGLLMLAYMIGAGEDGHAELLGALLTGNARNRWTDFVAAARASSRRAVAEPLQDFLTGVLDGG